MVDFPTPHGDKLRALLSNTKLPPEDRHQVNQASERYNQWRENLAHIQSSSSADTVYQMVSLLNEYKLSVDVDLIFDSSNDFLYRQKGQIKLDNSIIEEFLPILVTRVFASELTDSDYLFGPRNCFSAVRFESSITEHLAGGGMKIRSKDQDFVIGRRLFLSASHQPNLTGSVTEETCIAYVAAEIKTNLDKTMYQEAASTALDVKLAVPGAKYYLLCEWLDMTPISTTASAIDEVIVLRKSRRLSANLRSEFNTVSGRQRHRDAFVEYLTNHPLHPDTFGRFLEHIGKLISAEDAEGIVLDRGYF
jgi:hypothetical protein